MTEKQKRFADFYIKFGNATEAAKKAGYSVKTAYSLGSENLSKPEIKAYIDSRIAKADKKRIASADEVLEFLTKAMQGKFKEECVAVEGEGYGCSKAKIVKKAITPKDRLKAAELLGKRFRLFVDEPPMAVDDRPVIVDDIQEDEA